VTKPQVLIFASGTAEGGGSGFENLVDASDRGSLDALIIGVVSNHLDGGVRKRAGRLLVPFIHFPQPWTAEAYQKITEQFGADFFALSGWLKLVVGLDMTTRFNPRTVFNIHPGLLPEFGGVGMYGHRVHEAVMAAYKRGEIIHSGVSMHFVTEPRSKADYDRGPVFFRRNVNILEDDTPKTLGTRVSQLEHRYQPFVTNLVVNNLISWDGVNPDSLKLPAGLVD